MKRMIQLKSRASGLVLALALATSSGYAQVVELSPGYIEGDVQVGSETIYWMRLRARSDDFTAEQYFSPGLNVAPYSLTVQVEEGTTRDYSVDAYIGTGSQTEMVLRNRVVTVEPGETSALDFSVPDPTYVQASVDILNGDISSWRIYAYEVGGDFDNATRYQNVGAGTTSQTMAFPMGNSEQVRCYGYVWRPNGSQTNLPQKYVDVIDGVADCSWTVEFPETGSVSGSVEFSGSRPIARYTLNLYGATNRWVPLSPPFSGPGNLEEFSIPDLYAGSYYFSSSYAQTASPYSHLFYFPESAFSPSRTGLAVAADSDTQVDIHSCQAYASGYFLPSGSTSMDDVAYGEIRYRPDSSSGSISRGALSRNQFDSSTGAYEAVMSEGPWYGIPETYVVYQRPYSDPDGYINQYMTVYPGTYLSERYFELGCGENYPLDQELPTGRVTINFGTADGSTFTNPQVGYGTCDFVDPDTGALLYRYTLTSNTSGAAFSNVTEASVTLEAPDGICNDLKAQAFVNGTLTTFAEINDLEFDSGVTVNQDIGGPSLTATYPEPGLIVDADEITATGVVTDDVDIAFVTVNGITATLESTGNPEDPVEQSFVAVIPLPVKGPNVLTFYAEDGSGKSTETSYVIFNDAGAPSISLAPANGLVTSEMLLDIDVTAADDAGISTLTVSVDGAQILSLDGEGTLELSALEPYNFGIGTHTIVAVATDISDRTTARIHQLEVIDNSPPTVTAEGPWSVNEGSEVMLSALASDPDGDPLTVVWDLDGDGIFDDAEGLMVLFDAAALDGPAEQAVAIRVTDDGGLSASDASTVGIENVAPVPAEVAVPQDPVALGSEIAVSMAFEDAGIHDTHTLAWSWDDGSSSAAAIVEADGSGEASGAHVYSAPGIYRVSCVLLDDDGGEAPCAAEAYVVVYDPDGGFVTGGGYIQSPAGAYAEDPGLAGRAHFGFVAKYKKGQSTPSGQTEFQFKAGDLDFHSSVYDWLVVAGPKAQFKGEGSINGQPGYGFMLTAIDGKLTPSSIDAFRIRIWGLADESAVYDNKPGADDQSEDLTELEHGSIVIHKK